MGCDAASSSGRVASHRAESLSRASNSPANTHCSPLVTSFSPFSRRAFARQGEMMWCGTGALRLYHTTSSLRRAPQARASDGAGNQVSFQVYNKAKIEARKARQVPFIHVQDMSKTGTSRRSV